MKTLSLILLFVLLLGCDQNTIEDLVVKENDLFTLYSSEKSKELGVLNYTVSKFEASEITKRIELYFTIQTSLNSSREISIGSKEIGIVKANSKSVRGYIETIILNYNDLSISFITRGKKVYHLFSREYYSTDQEYSIA